MKLLALLFHSPVDCMTQSVINTAVYLDTNFIFFLILCTILLHASFLCNYLALVYNFIFLHSKLAAHSHNKSFSLFFLFLERIKAPSIRSLSSKILVQLFFPYYANLQFFLNMACFVNHTNL